MNAATVPIEDKYSPLRKKNYVTNKTNVYHIDDIWIIELLNLVEYGP